MRARLLALAFVHLAASSCGTGVFVHTFEVVIADPAGRLGPPPVEVGIFDYTMGRSEEWARRTSGTAAPGAPYRGEHRAVESRMVMDSSPAPRVAVGLWLPAYQRAGFFHLIVEPRAGDVQRVTLPFVPWADSYPEGTKVVPLSATVRSTAGEGAWVLHLTLEVPPAAE